MRPLSSERVFVGRGQRRKQSSRGKRLEAPRLILTDFEERYLIEAPYSEPANVGKQAAGSAEPDDNRTTAFHIRSWNARCASA